VVINVPAAAAVGGSGVACTISKTGSREIEVRCELPIPAAAAGGSARPHSSAGHGHSHSHGHDHGSINLRSAVLHVIGDLLQSVGVAIAGGLIWLHQDDPRWYLVDPICTFVFSVVVLLTTKSILRDIVHVLMERTPPNMDVPAVAQVSGTCAHAGLCYLLLMLWLLNGHLIMMMMWDVFISAGRTACVLRTAGWCGSACSVLWEMSECIRSGPGAS
jgi:divalent metal cation (Fe/Co/Zn/Cd) transporter